MLATLDDLAAIGGVPVDASAASEEGQRAERLLELASAAVLTLAEDCGVTGEVIEGWSEHRRDSLAGIVAEIAVKRLNVAAAPSVDPYTYGTPSMPQTLRLNRPERKAVIDLIAGATDEWPKP